MKSSTEGKRNMWSGRFKNEISHVVYLNISRFSIRRDSLIIISSIQTIFLMSRLNDVESVHI